MQSSVASCTARSQARQKADSARTERLSWELGCLSNTSLQVLNGYPDASEPYAGLCYLMWSWIMAELWRDTLTLSGVESLLLPRANALMVTWTSFHCPCHLRPLSMCTSSSEQTPSVTPRRSTLTHGPPDWYTPWFNPVSVWRSVVNL